MWTRKELKTKAKADFRGNYWKCVLVALILALITTSTAGSSGSAAGGSSESSTTVEDAQGLMDLLQTPEAQEVLHVIRTIAIILLVLNLLVLKPLQVGCKGFFMKNCREKADLSELGTAFKPSWLRNVLGMFLTDLFVALWCLLFIIPGLVKAYAYRLVPYIMADDPDIDAMDAIKKSQKMMKGHKWNAFVLDLSFLGWYFLGTLTAGILWVFYVQPYEEQTDAELYEVLKAGYIEEGVEA